MGQLSVILAVIEIVQSFSVTACLPQSAQVQESRNSRGNFTVIRTELYL